MPTDNSPDDNNTGLVIASYGRRGVLVDAAGLRHKFVLKGRKLRAVCGDHVTWQPTTASEPALVNAIAARRNVLERPDMRGKTEPLAANLDQLLVVLAPQPDPDYFMIDRFLCAAELMGAAAALVWNKADLATAEQPELAEYARLGYAVLPSSVIDATGIVALRERLAKGISILVGQSGVGKSSLINALLPHVRVPVGPLSTGSGEGKHTTTASYMHELDSGGQLIDSPGVREFAPHILEARSIQVGFREVVDLAEQCRFGDCQHTREPNCAVKAALDGGEISQRRYDSYKRLRNMQAAAQPNRH
jgi:ribosome biogenesis GTPase